MANYVLVHGGRSDGHVWSQVFPLLQEHGHHVFCPTLSRPENSGLSDHISEVCSLIENEDINNVILVGHSYGGIVITGIANRMPEKIDRLIYVDSVVPENGKALYDFFEPAKYGLEPLKPFVEPLYFDEGKIKRIPKTYIHCKRSEFLEVGEGAFKSVFDRAKQDNWSYFELNTSHKCMVTPPKELTDILLGKKKNLVSPFSKAFLFKKRILVKICVILWLAKQTRGFYFSALSRSRLTSRLKSSVK